METNIIHTGDCIKVMRDFPDNSVDLIVTDPPYNIGKDSWDKIKNYLDWLIERFIIFEKILKENGTLWFFHTKFKTISAIDLRLEKETNFRHKQLIIINKGLQSIVGKSFSNLRSLPKSTEYLQFYTFEDITGSEKLNANYEKINPMAKYLKEEFKKAKVSNLKIARLFPSKSGGITGCVSNWLLGYNFPTKEQYEKMRTFLNYEYLRKEYEDLRKEYEDLRKEYEDLRYTFNLIPRITDVLNINFYQNNIKGHKTIKPINLMKLIINIASNENDIILDPFCGSGTTCVAAKILGRRYIGIEIEPKYVKIAEERLAGVNLDLFND